MLNRKYIAETIPAIERGASFISPRARRRIGLINAGTQIGAQAAEYLGPTLDDAFREGMITGSRR
jgi:hypothetical protein